MHDNDDLDRLLDSAVASYSRHEPETGLDRRILAHVAAEAAQPAKTSLHWLVRRRLYWSVALSLAACLLLMLAILYRPALPVNTAAHRLPALAVPAPHRALTAETTAPGGEIRDSAHSGLHALRARERQTPTVAEAAPKLEVFPTPQPLTPAEQQFANFAAAAPVPERRALVEAQKSGIAPISIAAIHMPLLAPPEKDTH